MNQHVTQPGPIGALNDEGRRGHFMRLRSGAKYWPCDPDPREIFIDDIAHALARQCRYNGHTAGPGEEFYSVAEHSVFCSHYVPAEDALEALLHDAAEAFVGDVIRPLKVLPEIAKPFKQLEELNEAVIAVRFGIRFPYPRSIKVADEALCTRELKTIMNGVDRGALHDETNEAPFDLQCVGPAEATRQFLWRFDELMAARGRNAQAIKAFYSPSFAARNPRRFATQ